MPELKLLIIRAKACEAKRWAGRPAAIRRLWNQLIIFLQSDCDTVFLGFCDEVIFRALPMTSQIQGRREILYFGLKSHVIFISITLQCSRWLMCLVIALFSCRHCLSSRGRFKWMSWECSALAGFFFFVPMFFLTVSHEPVRRETNLRPLSCTYPLQKTTPLKMSSITIDKLRLSAQSFYCCCLFWGGGVTFVLFHHFAILV